VAAARAADLGVGEADLLRLEVRLMTALVEWFSRIEAPSYPLPVWVSVLVLFLQVVRDVVNAWARR
jgi:hypothetical protein